MTNQDRIIYSPTFGKVYNIGYDSSYGNYVDIIDSDSDHHWLCHLSEVYVSLHEEVRPETKIGKMGRTGRTTGIHLHYELRNPENKYGVVINPCDWMGIPNRVGTYNEKDYSIYGDELKTLAKNTNLRNQPTINSSEKTKYIVGTTLFVLEPSCAEADGFIWDKVRIRVNGKEGYMINKNYME